MFVTLLQFCPTSNIQNLKSKKTGTDLHQPLLKLLVFALTSGFRFLLPCNRRLLVVFSFSDFLDDTVTRSLSLETSESAVQGFIFFNFNLTHL